MKKNMTGRMMIAALFVIGGFVSINAPAHAATNLVNNGNLETASANSATRPLGWTSAYWGTITGKFTYPVAGKNGGKAAQVLVTKYTSGDAKWYFDHVAVTPGTTYQFTEDYTSNVVTNLTAEFKMQNGTYSYVWLANPAASAAGWTTVTGTFVPPAGAVSVSVIHAIQKVGSLTIDNVSLSTNTPTPPGPVSKPVITSFVATPSSILVGSSTTLTWAVQQASSTSIDQGVGVVAGTSKQVNPIQTIIYTLTATNPGGSTTATTSVTVTTPPPPSSTPSCTLTANPTSVVQGGSSTLTFSSQNATGKTIDQGVGAVATSGTKIVTPSITTLYTETVTGPGGTGTCSAQVAVTLPQPPPSGNNLVNNGNFETASANSATRPLGWTSNYWGTITGKFTYPVAGKNGGKAAQVLVTKYTSGDAKWYFDHIPVTSGTVYQFSEDYMSNVTTNLTVEFLMSDNTYQYFWIANAPSTGNAWSTFTTQVTVPTGAVSMSILHALVSVGSLTTDNVSVVALPQTPFAQGMITLTLDDGLLSQFQNARPILNLAGIKAGFYIITQEPDSGDEEYMSWAQIAQLKADGFEIGGHTRTHPDLTLMTTAQATAEIKGSYDDLVAKGITPKAFVYPLGALNPSIQQLVQNAGYTIARGSYWGLNTPTSDKLDLFDMRLDKTTTFAQAKGWIDQAIANKRWLVLEIHDVLPSGGDDYAISTTLFQQVVNYIKSSGIKAVTLEEGRGLMQ